MENIFNKPLPTKIDVDKLNKRFPNLVAGLIIKHADVEKTIDLKRDTYRYKTVIDAWRKDIETRTGHILVAIRNQGFLIPKANERIDYSLGKGKTAARALRRGAEVAMNTDATQLDSIGKANRDHCIRIGSSANMMPNEDLIKKFFPEKKKEKP